MENIKSIHEYKIGLEEFSQVFLLPSKPCSSKLNKAGNAVLVCVEYEIKIQDLKDKLHFKGKLDKVDLDSAKNAIMITSTEKTKEGA